MNTLLNLSGAYSEEGWDAIIAADPSNAVIDLKQLEGANCYCDKEAEDYIRSTISPFDAGGIHWIDTGDYHYISKIWMEKIREPFTLALFDNHPDDQEEAFGGELLSCGSWVRASRQSLPMLRFDILNGTGIPEGLPVYLSIDMDVLSREFARTNWDQGCMTLDELIACIDTIRRNHVIIGVDICGGITASKGACGDDYATNLGTRKALLSLLAG